MFNLGLLFTFYDDCDDDGGSVGDSDDDDAGGQVSGRVGLEQGATSSAPQGRNPQKDAHYAPRRLGQDQDTEDDSGLEKRHDPCRLVYFSNVA